MGNVWKALGAVAVVGLLLTLGFMHASAATTVPNNSPAGAVFIDNQMHTVPVEQSLWYRFNYYASKRASERTPIYLTLVNGNHSGIEMSVYTFDQVNDDLADRIENWRNQDPVGRGTPQRYSCSNHIPRANGDCVSNDLTWVGTFATSGTYFVRIRNTNPYPTNFVLTVQGADVSLTGDAQLPMHNQ
jgi:hypothetical protein